LISSFRRPSHPPASPSRPTSDSRQSSAFSGSAFQPNLRFFIGYRVSNVTFPPTADSHRLSTFRICPPILTSGFHRRHIFGLSLRTQLPACAEICILRFCQRPTFELDRSLNPPAVPSISNRLASAFNHSAVPATNFPISFDC
jgi:hypothetical protein